MTIRRLCNVHKIEVFEPQITSGIAFGVVRDYHYDSPDRVIRCRVVQLDVSERTQLLQEGWVATHRIFFAFDPKLTLLSRLRFPVGVAGTILRPDPATNAHFQNRMWFINAAALSEDNPKVTTPG